MAKKKQKFLRSTNDEFDQFDSDFDHNFQKEFEAIERENRKFPTLLFAIFLSVAVLMLAIALFTAVHSIRTVKRWTAVPGEIVEVTERRVNDPETGRGKFFAYPVVEFTLPGGRPQRVEIGEGVWPPSYSEGDPVTVLVDPAQPQSASIQSSSTALFLWLVPGITGFLGLVFLFLTLILLRLHKSQNGPKDNR